MYDPNPGRFLSEDPLGYEAGDANLDRYVLNSPVNYLDPTGEAPVPVAPPPTPLPTPTPTPTPTPLPTPTPKPPIPGLGVLGGAAIILLQDLLFPRPLNVGEDEFLEQLECKKPKYKCTARCPVQQIDPKAKCPELVFGTGIGSSPGEASRAAKRDANSKIPRGCKAKHCTVRCKKIR